MQHRRVGDYSDASGIHGFVYSGGVFKTIDDPSATLGTIVLGINDSGTVVGTYTDATGMHGFLESGGVFAAIDDPNAGSGGTSASGINNHGEIVGYYHDAAGQGHGFTAIAGTVSSVPEPTTIALFAAALGSVCFLRRRKQI
jgi:hypothetical protein